MKIVYDKTGKSRGYGFVYMETTEGVHAVEEYATECGYRVEMYGRKNVQLHKHMVDRSKILPQRSTLTMRRSISASGDHYVTRNQPMTQSSESSTFSRTSPTLNALSSSTSLNSQTVYYDPNIYPTGMFPPHRPYESSVPTRNTNPMDTEKPDFARLEPYHSLHSQPYHYNPILASTSPYYLFSSQGAIYHPPNDLAYDTGAYTLPMYSMTNSPAYSNFTQSYPSPTLKPVEPSFKDNQEAFEGEVDTRKEIARTNE